MSCQTTYSSVTSCRRAFLCVVVGYRQLFCRACHQEADRRKDSNVAQAYKELNTCKGTILCPYKQTNSVHNELKRYGLQVMKSSLSKAENDNPSNWISSCQNCNHSCPTGLSCRTSQSVI